MYRRIGKRCIDAAVAAALLLLTAPVLAVTAAAIRLSMGPPVFFRQRRPGLHGVPFAIVKFRTMTVDPGADVDADAQRLTRLGRVLRATSLDELPELWNVVRGDMSLVGPRPLLLEYVDRYTPEQARRHDVRPGITGWAQVNGRNAISWEDKLCLDRWYVGQCSLRLDLRILAMTVRKVIAREGISQPGYSTVSKFVGTRR